MDTSKNLLLASSLVAISMAGCTDPGDNTKKAVAACAALSSAHSMLCRDSLTYRLESLKYVPAGDAARLGQLIAGLVTQMEAYPDNFCKVRANGIIHCVPFDRVIAWTDPDLLTYVIKDTNAIAKQVSIADNVWFKCQDGTWGSIEAESRFRVGNWITGAAAKRMSDKCEAASASSGAGTSGGAVGGGFTGITGLDLKGQFCALGAATVVTTAAEMIESAFKYMEEMQQQCMNTFLSQFTEGDVAKPEDGSANNKSKNATVNIKDNGDGTETVTERDGEGNIVEMYQRGRTSTNEEVTVEYREDGTTVVHATNPPPDPDADPGTDSPVWSARIERPGAGYWEIRVYDDGRMTESGQHVRPDGRREVIVNRPRDCVDGTCQACRSLAQESSKLRNSCLAGSGPGQLCADFERTSSCCGAGGGPYVDPRLVLPNPQSDLVCVDPSPDVQDQRCKAHCQVATTDTDCYTSCYQTNPVNFEFALLDQICRYAYSEDCFSNVAVQPEVPEVSPGDRCMLISCPIDNTNLTTR